MTALRKILLVDDEQHVLDALQRQLRNRFQVIVAAGGKPALAMIDKESVFDVIVSDMRMPEMDGLAFLEHAREKCPDAVRMMLTGNADQETAVNAINRRAIFRFLNKPCPTDALVEAILACGVQHDLIVAEKDLLESTLTGAVRALVDILSISHPESFGRSQMVRTRAKGLANRLGDAKTWSIELAALFSRIGSVVMPPALIQKVRAEEKLSDYERTLLAKIPALGANVLRHIPRLEETAEIVRLQATGAGCPSDASFQPVDETVLKSAEILRLLNDIADLEYRGMALNRAFFVLRCHASKYDPVLFATAEEMLLAGPAGASFAINLADLRPGMKLMADILSQSGSLLVSGGTSISEALVERLNNCAPSYGVQEPVFVDRPPRACAA
jgi:response regulator RpfG family c-di-GMP phosphodiesterase